MASEKWSVLWCGHRCAGSPHLSRKAAEEWLADLRFEAKAAGQPMYGGYEIRKEPSDAE